MRAHVQTWCKSRTKRTIGAFSRVTSCTDRLLNYHQYSVNMKCTDVTLWCVRLTAGDRKDVVKTNELYRTRVSPIFFMHITIYISSHHITSHPITSHPITSHHIPSHDPIPSYPIISHPISSHHITSHHITYHITSHHITSHHISHHITSHYITLHYITLHYITLHYITLHYITSHHITSHHITSHHITSHHITLHYVTLHYITLRYNTIHYITSSAGHIYTVTYTAIISYCSYPGYADKENQLTMNDRRQKLVDTEILSPHLNGYRDIFSSFSNTVAAVKKYNNNNAHCNNTMATHHGLHNQPVHQH